MSYERIAAHTQLGGCRRVFSSVLTLLCCPPTIELSVGHPFSLLLCYGFPQVELRKNKRENEQVMYFKKNENRGVSLRERNCCPVANAPLAASVGPCLPSPQWRQRRACGCCVVLAFLACW